MRINLRLICALLPLFVLVSCGECKVYRFVAFENSLSSSVEFTFQVDDLDSRENKIRFTELLSANENKNVTVEISGVTSSSTKDCEDTSRNWPNKIEISSDSLSLYTFCESGNIGDDSRKIRIDEFGAICNQDEEQVIDYF